MVVEVGLGQGGQQTPGSLGAQGAEIPAQLQSALDSLRTDILTEMNRAVGAHLDRAGIRDLVPRLTALEGRLSQSQPQPGQGQPGQQNPPGRDGKGSDGAAEQTLARIAQLESELKRRDKDLQREASLRAIDEAIAASTSIRPEAREDARRALLDLGVRRNEELARWESTKLSGDVKVHAPITEVLDELLKAKPHWRPPAPPGSGAGGGTSPATIPGAGPVDLTNLEQVSQLTREQLLTAYDQLSGAKGGAGGVFR